MSDMTCAILGYGNRGSVYQKYLSRTDGVKTVAVCDVRPANLAQAKKDCGLSDDACFADEDEFFSKKRADALIIATMDKQHFAQTLRALKLGYDILLEKPIGTTLEECAELQQAAREHKNKVVVCYVLRYTEFFRRLKAVLSRPDMGDIVAIREAENVHFVHYWLSFLHGNWRNATVSSPIILQKCCHDFDILNWLVNRKCVGVSSFGNRLLYKKENTPATAAEFCYKCPLQNDCTYSGIRIMTKDPLWLKGYFPDMDVSPDGVRKVLSDENNRFSRCAFAEDNNVVENQIVNLYFDNGIVAQHIMSGFSAAGRREIDVYTTKGEVTGSIGAETARIVCRKFQEEPEIIEFDLTGAGEHGGGDANIVTDFVRYVRTGEREDNLSLLDDSFSSSQIAFAAETSRRHGGEIVKIN